TPGQEKKATSRLYSYISWFGFPVRARPDRKSRGGTGLPPGKRNKRSGVSHGCDFMSSRTSPEEGLLAGSTAFKALLDSSSDLLAILQPDGTLSYTNEGFLRILGYMPGEILGKTLEKLHHPAELNAMAYKLEEAKSRPEQKVAGRCRLRSKEGSWLWFDFEISNHLHTAGIEALLASFQNVTDLRRLEAERQVISDVVHALNQTSNLDQLL